MPVFLGSAFLLPKTKGLGAAWERGRKLQTYPENNIYMYHKYQYMKGAMLVPLRQNLCDNCHAPHEAGIKAEFMAYDQTEGYSEWEGGRKYNKWTLYNFVPFSVWICEECIKKERKKSKHILFWLVLSMVALSIFYIVPNDWKFFVGVVVACFVMGLLYSITVYFKPYQKITDYDIYMLFMDAVHLAREATGRQKQMVLEDYYKEYGYNKNL